ncbi:MAG: hypothetical protein J7K94_05710 [Dehalococcoidia bacterium]|nr:hypothetical protein [Dehalococcoidia bacterium]
MKKYALVLLVAVLTLLSFAGCTPSSSPQVALQSPANGSSASSLTPILAWNCNEPNVSFRIQVASDSNFQNLVIDQSALPSPSYAIPPSRLSNNQPYYWKVNASKAGQTSEWTPYWSFNITSSAGGTATVKATLDGNPWSGNVNYTLSGAKQQTGTSVAQNLSGLTPGSYTLGYNSGGPSGASLKNITPSATQNLLVSSGITFTLNFVSQSPSTVVVHATLDGNSWSGKVHYNINGPYTDSLSSVPQTFDNMSAGTYTVGFRSGGPNGATLSEISPSSSQTLSNGGIITFTLNFHSQSSGTIKVNAMLDGRNWSGNINYTVNGPYDDSSSYVPDSFGGLPRGTYSVNYRSGGPNGATLAGISPSPSQTLDTNGTITFTFNFQSQTSSGTIRVNATLDGRQWSGYVNYVIHGPYDGSGSNVPNTLGSVPPGNYSLNYISGGPQGAELGSISPQPNQYVNPGGTISFTMNFHSQGGGTINVMANIDGSPWQGEVHYTIRGPYTDSSSSAPDQFTDLPAGTYTLSYTSGGPHQCVLESISPSPTQQLCNRCIITFTLNFHFQSGILPE